MTAQIKQTITRHLYDYQTLYTFSTVLLMMGVIFGALIVNSLALSDKKDLYIYLTQFFGQVSEGHLASSRAVFTQSLTHYFKYIGLIWLLGLSIIGLPLILILLFLKGVVVGFTVGFLVSQMNWYGLLLSFVSILPQNFVLIPAFIIVSTVSVAFSLELIQQQVMKKKPRPFFPQFTRYTLLVGAISIVLLFVALFEAYVSPVLMRAVIN